MNKLDKSNRYESINGLRAIACLGIVLMHVKANITYSLSNSTIIGIISNFTNFVFLFMVISSFGMCCGYFNKIANNEISPEKFYSKRIKKILPFFMFLILLDLIIEHNIPAIIEGFANSTLLFGLLQKNIEVIGVAWYLGLTFIFYLMFPYFTYLFSNKKRAWLTTIMAVLMNLSCIYYFDVGRTNMFYSFIFFCIGGLLFLYKENIIKFYKTKRILGLIFVITSAIFFFTIPAKNIYILPYRSLLLAISLLCYGISYDSKLLNNKVTTFLGNISFEIYLCHMVIFRIIDKMNLVHIFNNNWCSYICTTTMVIIGSVILSVLFKKICMVIEKKVLKI